jgi:membrane protease YdiL (CAAX protease family)
VQETGQTLLEPEGYSTIYTHHCMMPDSSTPPEPPENNETPPLDEGTATPPINEETPATPEAAADDTNEAPEAVPEHLVDLWEAGENSVTLFLRAAFTCLAGWFLLWCQQRSTFVPGLEWNRWITLSVTANLLFPLFIVWMFFGHGLGYLDWLRDQKLNAWNYGWNWRAFKRHILMALVMFVVMLPILWFASRNESAQVYYRQYFPTTIGAGSWLYLIGTLIVYMFCWEWFFRGFLLFGMAQGWGAPLAIGVQAVLFGLAHGTKPGPEMWSSFAGGLILGILCWREKSFVPAFLAHALIHVAWALLILR